LRAAAAYACERKRASEREEREGGRERDKGESGEI
jgi:hypothetical protein